MMIACRSYIFAIIGCIEYVSGPSKCQKFRAMNFVATIDCIPRMLECLSEIIISYFIQHSIQLSFVQINCNYMCNKRFAKSK